MSRARSPGPSRCGLRVAWLVGAALLVSACSSGAGTESASDSSSDSSGRAAAGAPTPGDSTDPVDAAGPVADASEPTPPEPPPTPVDRGLVPARAIIHLHSAFSHDGCDDEGLDESGVPNWPCIRRMKAALCKRQIAVAFMTDHPSEMKHQPFETLFYAEPEEGDELLQGEDGAPYGVVYDCAEGQGGPDGRTRLVVGFEGHHTMPLGLRGHLDPFEAYDTKFVDSAPDEALLELTTAVRARGGLMCLAHTEDADVSAELIGDHDVPSMELYNFHANFDVIRAGGDEGLKLFDSFMMPPGPEAPDSDLLGLVMLDVDNWPIESLEKWRRVVARRSITPVAGSDVHENVILPALCAIEGLCDGLAEEVPNLVEALSTEGPLILSDGERLDSYERIMGWVDNQLYLDPDADVIAAAQAALEEGRNLVVFRLFGEPEGADLHAVVDGEVLETGAEIPLGEGAQLVVSSPIAPGPGAVLDATLWHHGPESSEAVMTWSEPGVTKTWAAEGADAIGAYQLEVLIQPGHLAADLGPVPELAGRWFRWLESSAIRVVEE